MMIKSVHLFFLLATGLVQGEPLSSLISMNSIDRIQQKYRDEEEYKEKTVLAELMLQCGVNLYRSHDYMPLYAKILEGFETENLSILELVTGDSSNFSFPSLFGWSHYLQNARIYGITSHSSHLFSTQKIETYFSGVSNEKEIETLLTSQPFTNLYFDIIIDDGSHGFLKSLAFLLSSLDKLKSGGLYFIESLDFEGKNFFPMILNSLKEKGSLSYIELVEIPNCKSEKNRNSLIMRK